MNNRLHFSNTNMTDRVKCDDCSELIEFRGSRQDWHQLFDHAEMHNSKRIQVGDTRNTVERWEIGLYS